MKTKNEMIKKPDSSEMEKKTSKPVRLKKYVTLSNSLFVLTGIVVIVFAVVMSNSIRKGSEDAQRAYDNAKDKAEKDAYDMFYDTAYASAERKYHVSNRVSIDVASVREEANLEVLKVSDVEYVIESRESDNIEVWMEFLGDGVYTIDMRASEFVIDNDRQYVLVRVPKPILSNCRITDSNQLFWKNGLFDKSIPNGVDIAVETRKAGLAKLNNYMKSNARFYKSAKESAQMVIEDLVKGLNSELTDLVVEVEFVG